MSPMTSVQVEKAMRAMNPEHFDPNKYHLYTTLTCRADLRPRLQGMSRNRMEILVGCFGKPGATMILWRLWRIANPNERSKR